MLFGLVSTASLRIGLWVGYMERLHASRVASPTTARAVWPNIEIVAAEWMPTLAVCLIRVPSLAIDLNRYGFQVKRAATVANLAEMIDLKTVGNLADEVFM